MDRLFGSAIAEERIVEKLIERSPTQIRDIMAALRAVAKANMPAANEFVYHDAINYKLTESPGTWICYIAAQKSYTRLGFYFGVNLSDPKELLEGAGKRMRHVKVRSVEEACTNEMAELIRQAWADAIGNSGNAGYPLKLF